MDKEDILRGLRKIDVKAKARFILIDLSIYGGAAMAIAFNVRRATRDVDAVVNGAPEFLRIAVAEVALEEGWPEDWMNDGVKGFTSSREVMFLMQSFMASDGAGLRIHTPSPEYMFAMKCMAMRPEGLSGSRDISDIEALADLVGVSDLDTALSIVEAFYPARAVPPKVRFGLEEIMERLIARRTQN